MPPSGKSKPPRVPRARTSLEASNSPQFARVSLTVQTVGPDFDGDADVDSEDFGHLQRCFNGMGVPPFGEHCQDADLDNDDDVDDDDLQIFLNCMSGANHPADRLCAGAH